MAIPEIMLEPFKSNILNFNFNQSQVLEGYYKDGFKEYVFNGTLE